MLNNLDADVRLLQNEHYFASAFYLLRRMCILRSTLTSILPFGISNISSSESALHRITSIK